MPSPAPSRPLTARLAALLGVAALAGCGNRGELYLEPETDLERLGDTAPGTAPDGGLVPERGLVPEGGSVPGGAVEPGVAPEPGATPAPLGPPTIVPEGGVAPSVDPDPGASESPAVGGAARDEESTDDDGETRRSRRAPDASATDGTDR